MVIKGGIHAVIHVALGGYIGVRIPQKTFIDYIEQYCYKNRQENRGERQNERAHCARWSVRAQRRDSGWQWEYPPNMESNR